MRARFMLLLGLSLLCIPALRLVWTSPAPPSVAAGAPVAPQRARSPFDQALWAACRCQTRAKRAMIQQREELEAWDPAAAGLDDEVWRRELMASDPDGDLRRARAYAQRAAELARTPREAYRAALLLVRIECDAGDHEEELRQAQRLMALDPEDPQSLRVLQHAAGCSGDMRLRRWAAERRSALTDDR